MWNIYYILTTWIVREDINLKSQYRNEGITDSTTPIIDTMS